MVIVLFSFLCPGRGLDLMFDVLFNLSMYLLSYRLIDYLAA